MMMEDIGDNIEFSDWPEQPADLSGSNPWLPAYGFMPPHAHLNKDDFFGNPDGELFLQGASGTSYAYLETIQEETQDDLQSADNISEAPSSLASSQATDIDSMSTHIIIDDMDNESDREVACPKKRRRHENNLYVEDDDESLSRSSSLLQFENLEKQCQDYTSPSIYTNYTYDSLERKSSVSPDSLENTNSDDNESAESDYYKTFKIDMYTKKKQRPNNNYTSDVYASDDNKSETDNSGDSEETLEASNFGSNSHLKTWHSLDGLANHTKTVKISAENLSEDSGYSDHLNKSSSISNITIQHENKRIYKTCTKIYNNATIRGLNNCKVSNSSSGFNAYDGDVFNQFTTTFGVSLHDLSSTDTYERNRTQLIDRFLKNGASKRRFTNVGMQSNATADTNEINIEKVECLSKFNYNSASEPNLLSNVAQFTNKTSPLQSEISSKHQQSYFENLSCEPSISSVPKDLNFIGEFNQNNEHKWGGEHSTNHSIASKNCDIHDLSQTNEEMPKLTRYQRAEYGDKITIRLKYDSSSISSTSDNEVARTFKREGSYAEAMRNIIESEAESQEPQPKIKHKRTIAELDRLKAISECSLKAISEASLKTQSEASIQSTDCINTSTPILKSISRNVISTPNLVSMNEFNDSSDDLQAVEVKAKKSLSASTKGVHFYPVVQELNWLDRGYSAERESTASLTSDDEMPQLPPSCFINNASAVIKPDVVTHISVSQPDLRYFKKLIELNNDDADDALIDSHEDIMEIRAIPIDACSDNNNKRSMDAAVSAPNPSGRVWRSSNDVMVASKYLESLPKVSDVSTSLTHVSDVYVSPTASTKTAASSNKLLQRGGDLTVQAMESAVTHRVQPQVIPPVRTSNKIGGFFSRIASFRFSTRKKDEKNNKKKSAPIKTTQIDRTGQRIATKEDYIYIPLKGEINAPPRKIEKTELSQAGMNNKVSAKPPLPKVPPRIVGASVKKRSVGGGGSGDQMSARSSHECRTIDSGVVRPMEPMGLIETDLDTEVTVITSASAHVKTRSLMNLGEEAPTPSGRNLLLTAPQQHNQRPHKSMEFLLDKENLKVVEPPENELRKGGERVMSEHQLRVQRSLQKLNVPEWYKQGLVPREGFLLKKKPTTGRECRWQGTSGGGGTAGSKTTSLSSLGSTQHSPVLLSPTLHAQQPFVRWSTSKLNSTASSPCASTRSSFNARQTNGSISPSSSLRSSFNYRQPYLGWRSQERLSKPRTPAERLANTIINQNEHNHHVNQVQANPEIQSSIKEVTSAIVHYVSGLKPEETGGYDDTSRRGSSRSRSVSPRGSQRLCWLESSFVGTRPMDSPQTPVTLTESHDSPAPPTSLRLELQHNDVSLVSLGGSMKPSASSTTLEDVLDSLLGLPSSTRAPSPSLQETVSANTSPVRRRRNELDLSDTAMQFRRRSEGSEPNSRPSSSTRRNIFDTPPILRCRYSRCNRSALAKSVEGLSFKNCHNCSYTYCSRTCRRAHWERHRKTCLFSRVGTLCRQVIAAAKEQESTLHNMSLVARRGFLSHGAGAVKIFFPNPEAAEKFLRDGPDSEPTFVRWPDLLPSEMGPQLYAELVTMCKHYNPDHKLVLYVTICVVSEAPAAGAVKWERQLVSRCGKMRLSKNVHIPGRDVENPETLVLTSLPILEPEMLINRELVFKNIQRILLQRGVSLKRHYPEIYQQFCTYTEGTTKFTPVTVYPKDYVSGKTFMCIIMPDVEPECVNKVTIAGVRVRTVDVLRDNDPELL